MKKWKRLKKLREKERYKAEVLRPKAEVLRPKAEVEEVKQTEPEKISGKLGSTITSNISTILPQIPRYVYLLVIFALLAGVFFPLITPGVSFEYVIQGTAILFLGLAGGILLFKAATSDNRRGILIVIGFVLIAICLALVHQVQEAFRSAMSL